LGTGPTLEMAFSSKTHHPCSTIPPPWLLASELQTR
jgi:hypothetical protein